MKLLNLLTISCLVFVLYSCSSSNDDKAVSASDSTTTSSPNREAYLATVKEFESKAKASMLLNDTLGKALVKAYSDFAFAFPADSLSADFLFKAAEVATALGQYEQALVYYQTITLKYPTYKFIVESLYLQGHIYDNLINDDVKAKVIYEEVIQKYPQHKFAEDAKIQIKNLGKSDEELIKEFKEKNKDKSSANRGNRFLFPSFIVADNIVIG